MQIAMMAALTFLSLLTLISLLAGLHFVWKIGQSSRAPVSDDKLPGVAVFLALRGADAHLDDALRRLLVQEYPDFTVSIVVDSADDPAWESVRAVLKTNTLDRARVEVLGARLATCGRKCSALLQMLQHADASREVIVLVDGDVLPHRTWLRELVEPLQDPRVGLTFGNRWFVPLEGGWGSVLRYVWNASSVVAMPLLRTPWAGSCAMRRSAFTQVHGARLWSQAIVDDASIRTAILRGGFDIRFVPSLMMVNRDECGPRAAFQFVTRQLAWTRLYVPTVWALCVFMTVAISAVLAGSATLAALAVAQGSFAEASWCVGGLGVYSFTFSGLLYLMDRAIRQQALSRGETIPAYKNSTSAKMILAIPVLAGLQLAATIAAQFKRTFDWRGVRYRVHSPWNVQVIEERMKWCEPQLAHKISA
jgi:cellulose synthase/poly-beta-1,6-N-acetylglucosamine synthase-like glycosyltransferase